MRVRISTVNTLRMSAYAALSAMVMGCTSPLDKRGGLAQAWGERLAQYRIAPVFPPREDIQVGDIYLVCVPPAKVSRHGGRQSAELPQPLWVSSVPSLFGSGGGLEKFYEGRLEIPQSIDPPPPPAPSLQPVPSSSTLFTKGNATRLRTVSFPEFFSITASGADVSALIPTPAVLAGVGFTGEDIRSASVSIPAGESYGVPSMVFEDALKKLDAATVARLKEIRDAAGVNDKKSATTTAICPGRAALLGVTEVFAARSIDVKLDFKSAAGAKANAALSIEGTRQVVFDALKGAFSASKGDNTPAGVPLAATDPDKAANLVKSLKDLLASLDAGTRKEYPGVQVSVYTGSTSGVRMTRDFKQPVVIGYRGVSIEFDSASSALPVSANPGSQDIFQFLRDNEQGTVPQ